jgi:signal transduction histidine kinase
MKRLWRSLTVKWLFTLLFTGLFGVGLVGFFANRATNTGFDQLKLDQAQADYVTAAQTYYQAHGSWAGFLESIQPRQGDPSAPQGDHPPQGDPNQPPQPPTSRSPRYMLVDQSNLLVVPEPPFQIGDKVPDDQVARGTPITVDGKSVGTVLFVGGAPVLGPREQQYLTQTTQSLILGAIGASLIALFVGSILTRHFMRPLRDLTLALQAMRQGQLEQEVPVRSRDELGELTQAFNQMSKNLARANFLRRQMTADIAHDLRTPLTVIAGYLEGMQDGTLKPTAQRFETMNKEVVRLKRLVEDLRTLSLADAGELKLTYQDVPVEALLNHVADSFELLFTEKQLNLEVQVEPGLSHLKIDLERMEQVLGNLVSNAMRYTAPGGKVVLRAYPAPGALNLSVQDTGEGIPLDKLPYIFERLYRVDASRSGGDDESGLGLAIVKSIVEAHGSTVTAQSEVGKGTTITIQFPHKLLLPQGAAST